MKSDEELMEELSAGVQKIFEDAVKGTPFIPMETEKSDNQPSLKSKLCCVTQHKYNSTLREEKRREEWKGIEGVA
jgi:hypothetical protein